MISRYSHWGRDQYPSRMGYTSSVGKRDKNSRRLHSPSTVEEPSDGAGIVLQDAGVDHVFAVPEQFLDGAGSVLVRAAGKTHCRRSSTAIASRPAQTPEHGAHPVEQRAQLRQRRAAQLTADLQQIQAGMAFRSLASGDAEPACPVSARHRVGLGDVENDRLGGSV